MNQLTKIAVGGVTLSAAVFAVAAKDTAISEMMQREPLRILAPAMTDSVNTQGDKFGSKAMFGTVTQLEFNDSEGTLIKCDTAGVFSFRRPASGTELVVLTTNLRASRFAKGKLVAKGNVPFSLYVDNAEVASSDAESESEKSVPLTMEPERDYKLAVKLLVNAVGDSVAQLKLTVATDDKYPSAEVLVSPAMKRRFALDNSEYGARVRNVSLSPDGKYLLSKYQLKYALDNNTTEAVVTEVSSGKEITTVPDDAEWLPKGSRLSYTRPGRNGSDIYELEMSTLKRTLKASGVNCSNYMWSPDEKYLIYTKADDEVKEAGPLRRYTSPDDRIPGNRSRSQIYKYNIASGVSQPLTFGYHSAYPASISPDSRSLVYYTVEETPKQAPFSKYDMLKIDLVTLRTDTIACGEGSLSSAVYSPDGKQLFIVGSPGSFGGIGENKGEHPIANDFDNQGFLYTFATGKIQPMTRDFDPSVQGEPVWCARDGKIYFRAIEGFTTGLYSLVPATGKIERIPLEPEVVTGFSIGNDEARTIAYTGAGFDYVGRSYLYNIATRKSRIIDDPIKEDLDKIALGRIEKFPIVNSKGDTIDGVLCYPPDFDPSKKYPLIVYYYGGTTPTQASMSNPYAPHLFASRDYMVYVINPSGTIGYGQEFSARHVNAWGKQTADDIIEGTKQVLDKHPFINRHKVGCLGASYGGFMTQYLQTRTDMFAAAVSHAGISNVTSYWGEGYWGYSYNAIAAADSYPWNNPELFTQQGSLFNADKIHTPLLLLHGTVDTNVPIGESIQLFNALKILGRDVEFISVEGENHFISDYTKRQLWQNTIMAWFAKWLQDDPSWWDELYPSRNL